MVDLGVILFVFVRQVYKLLRTQGHKVVAVFTIPDVGGRPDPLAEAAEADGVPVLKFKQWRKKGQAIPEVSENDMIIEISQLFQAL